MGSLVSLSLPVLQITPLPAVVLAVLVCVVVQEPPRGHTDGGQGSQSLQGHSGVKAYLQDVKYCLTKSVAAVCE